VSSTKQAAAIETVLRRDRLFVAAALGTATALAWVYVIHLASEMDMGGMEMSGFRMAMTAAGMVMRPALQPWTGPEFLFTAAMWVVMMIGMMTPSAAPIILLYARVGRQAATEGKPFASTWWFVVGYLLAWTGFSLAATAAQWGLDRAALLTPRMASASEVLGGIVLIAAGVYQFSPLKNKCLTECQSPIQFIQRSGGFRRDPLGSARMGVSHGTYCVGCCWALMALLFVGGVMNVLWISAITILVLAEKIMPAGRLVPRIAGAAFLLAGVSLLVL
jgi:predicted metal-binding membrane protein